MKGMVGQLKPRERRGSKPRCHLITHGPAQEVADRLTSLVAPFASISSKDSWMPDGFTDVEEAELHKAPRLVPSSYATQLAEWWLPENRANARTPNFDIASTCTVEGKPGLLLVEAKAHEAELINEAAGRRLAATASEDRKASHKTIGAAVKSARIGLAAATSLEWRISRDSHYQMSNRFAWSWKLADLGVPVVLVYLGFLKADDMCKPGELPLADAAAWEALVRTQSAELFPAGVWGNRWFVNGVPFIPLIRSLELRLGEETAA
jgi:hypothetical protein